MGTCWQTRNRPATNTTSHRLYANRPGCPTHHHNTVGAYRMGCRCPEAVEARRLADKRRRNGHGQPRSYPATGTARRLGALMAAGHTATHIAEALRTDPETIRDIARGQRQRVLAATGTAVAALYQRWRDKPGTSRITATRAKAAGHVEPIWWDDDQLDLPDGRPTSAEQVSDEPDPIAVEKLLRGQLKLRQVTRPDRVEAVRQLANKGLDSGAIATRLHTSGKAIRSLLDAANALEAAA